MDFSCLFTVVVLPACFLLGRSASVHRIDCFCSSSRPFRFSPSIVYTLLASFALVRRLLLLFSLMDLGGVRRKMTSKNCERINGVKMVSVFKTLVRRRTTVFFKRYGNFILTPTVHVLSVHVCICVCNKMCTRL